MSKIKDETGNVYGFLTVSERVPNKNGTKARWKCICLCGGTIEADGDALRNGKVKSCGCHKNRAGPLNGNYKGGHYKDRLYHVWMSMKQRCTNPHNQKYKHYGARGIKVCDEWSEYEVFRAWAYENGYDDKAPYGKTTLDRIDTNGDYKPENCRFVNLSVQNKNRRPFKRKKQGGSNG